MIKIEEQIKELKKDFRSGQWQVPAAQVKAKQEEYRKLKFQLQMEDELEKFRSGNASQKTHLLPLIFRREFWSAPVSNFARQVQEAPQGELLLPQLTIPGPDGELWSFQPPQFTEVEIPQCGCGAVDENKNTVDEIIGHLAEPDGCPTQTIQKVQIEQWRGKHIRGSWLCRGCLSAAVAPETVLSASDSISHIRTADIWFNPDRQIKWCPNFILELAELGPVRYAIEMQNKQKPVCYAGLFHSEINFGPDFAEIIWKCDTCGLEHRNKEQAAFPATVKPGETLVTGIDTKQSAEVIQALTADPIASPELANPDSDTSDQIEKEE